MNIWWMIFLSGIGNYLMRCAGVWLPSRWVPTQLLAYLPLAVILVMTVVSLNSFVGLSRDTLAMAIASLAVIIASLKKLPLFVCIALGCAIFGAIASF